MTHYNQEYFEWQKHIGAFGGKANAFRYRPHVKPTDKVLDFGCGGGFLLAQLTCRERIGVEINPSARAVAGQLGIKCFDRIDAVDDQWADVIISNSALEHTHSPLDELKALYKKLRNGGTIVFSVPHEPLTWKFYTGDINQHLFSWSPMCAGNLFQESGFVVDQVSTERRVWPPFKERILDLLGDRAFGLLCNLCWFLQLVRGLGVRSGVIADVVVVARKSMDGKPVSRTCS